MKKRVLAGILMMVCVLASVMSVSAASPIAAPTVSTEKGDNISNEAGKYIIREGNDAWVDDDETGNPIAVKDDIIAFNAGTKKLDDVLANYSAVKDALAGMTALTKIFDLHDVNGGNPLSDGKHRVVVKVSTLPDNCTDVEVLHYSMNDKKWELLEESTFDKANKTVTVVSDDLSPIAIYAKTSTPSGGQGTAHPTVGTSSTWMLYAAIALVALGAGVVVYQKKSR